MTRFLMTALAGLLTVGCLPFSSFVHDETLVGPYRLNAVDIDEDMAICWSLPRGGCVGDGLPGPTVYAAGFDEKYLVAAVHPKKFADPLDRSVTNYYYVIRSRQGAEVFPNDGIKGPFSEAQFNSEKARLHLPEFSRVFDNLK